MISSPLILAAIYPHSREGVFYYSSITAFISSVIMIILCCRKDVKTLGKEGVSISNEKVSVELPIVKEHINKEEEKSAADAIGMNGESPTTNNESPVKLDDQPASIMMTSDGKEEVV